jgi:hypothetical protein
MASEIRRRSRGLVRRPAWALVAAAIAALLAACGGGDSGETEATPVEEQIGLDGDTVLERQARAENLIRDCMKAQGFDYIPVDPVAQQAALTGSTGLSKEEFEKQYGYGITTLYEERQQAAFGPNETIRNSLDAAGQAAYDRTLYGQDPTATFQVALDTGDFTRLGGCLKTATERVFGGAAVLQSLQTKLEELEERLMADPRMVKAVEQWSKCMLRNGFELSFPEQVDAVLQRKLDAIVGAPGSGTQNENYDRAALAALQREEVEMVNADIACEERHIEAVEEDVRAGLEADFRERNADLLGKVPQA